MSAHVQPEGPRAYPIREAAARLGFSRWALYDWIKQGRIRAQKIGRDFRIPADEVERVIREGLREGPDE